MKVTGFTFIRNAIKFDYPVVEAIKSILPLCDNFVVAVGNSEDGTRELISSINPEKIKIIDTIWDDSLREGGKVLAVETDKAFAAIDEDTDWCFYIQGDEVVHEQYHAAIKAGMEKWKDDKSVDGLLFKYLHFYGSYDYVGDSSSWYNNEIRIIRKNPKIYSYKDAQGFRKNEDEKLTVAPIDAFVYHYGWVKEPEAMQKKQEDFNKLWHDDEWVNKNVKAAEQFDYESHINALQKFTGTHPEVMEERIKSKNWQFDYDLSFNKFTLKQRVKNFLQNKLGYNLSYRNYILKK
ncbi:MAG: glycosyltransferase family 2 protein [Chitinophagaceae bacterium]